MSTIQDLLADHHYLHSPTQIDHFITVRAGGTPYGMYKQALRELDKRVRGLTGLYADRALLQIDIEELEFRTCNGKISNFDRRRAEVELRRKREAAPHLDQSIRDHERERDRFAEQARHLRGVLAEMHGVAFPLSPDDRDRLDSDMWKFLLKRDAAMELITRGAIEKNTLCMIMSLPQAVRQPILDTIKSQVAYIRGTGDSGGGPLLDWYFSHDAPRLPGEPCCESSPLPRLSENSPPTERLSA